MTWTRLPAITKPPHPCLNCPPKPVVLGYRGWIAVGFGYAGVSKDGNEVWAHHDIDEEPWKVRHAEKVARKDPDHDWRIHFEGPLYNATYQRQGQGVWVLVEKGAGFA